VSAIRVVEAEPLTKDGFLAFGEAIMSLDGAPPSVTGPGWSCWYPIGRIASQDPLEIGVVETQPLSRLVAAMERHTVRSECVVAVAAPIIQVVATATASDQPVVEQARAFLIEPGQAVVMSPGTWHAAALPLGERAVKYMFLLARPVPGEDLAGWRRFVGRQTLDIQTPLTGRTQ